MKIKTNIQQIGHSYKGETLTLQTLIKVSNDKGAESRRITAGNGNLLHNQ